MRRFCIILFLSVFTSCSKSKKITKERWELNRYFENGMELTSLIEDIDTTSKVIIINNQHLYQNDYYATIAFLQNVNSLEVSQGFTTVMHYRMTFAKKHAYYNRGINSGDYLFGKLYLGRLEISQFSRFYSTTKKATNKEYIFEIEHDGIVYRYEMKKG
jgi:hypothetical protein